MSIYALNLIFPVVIPAAVVHGLLTLIKIILFLAALIVAAGLSYILVRLIWRIRWRSQKQVNPIRLTNHGNLDSIFRIAALSPDHQLNFTYYMDGAPLPLFKLPPLPRIPAAPAPQVEYFEAPAQSAPAQGPVNPAQAQPSGAKKASEAQQKLAASAQKAGDNVQKISGISGMVIDILATVGSILPGSLGESFKQQANTLRSNKSAVNSTLREPGLKAQQVQHLQNQVQTLGSASQGAVPQGSVPPGGAAGAPANESPGHPVAATLSQATLSQATLSQAVPATMPAGNGNGRRPQSVAFQSAGLTQPYSLYVQPRPLAASQTYSLELSIDPRHKYRGGRYVYWLYTQQIEHPNLPPEESLEPQKTVQSITIKSIPSGYWVLTLLLSALVIILNLTWFFYFYVWLTTIFA